MSKFTFLIPITLLLILVSLYIPAAGHNHVAAAPAVAVTPATPAGLEELEELEAFMDGLMAAHMEEFKFVGAAISIVKDGELLLSKGYGYADPQQRIPVDPEYTLFRPGSVSKLFTWTAVMQLVEQGKINLHADVNEYLDFEIPPCAARPGQQPQPITMAHLLTHTPGFEDRGEGLFVLEKEQLLSLEDYLKNYLPARVFPPGMVLAYSNYGTSLAGYIVERVSGQLFEDYVEQHIFNPLGMERSTFRQPPELPDGELARAYNFAAGEYHEGSFEYISGRPAGSMSSTAADMAGFMIAHLQQGAYNGARILQEETAREMHRQQFAHHPMLDGMTYGFIENTFNGRPVLTHGGDTFLFHSGLYLLPEEGLGLFVSYSGGSYLTRERLFQSFLDRYYPAEPAAALQQADGAAQRAQRLLGEYHPNRRNFSTEEKLLGLMQAIKVGLTDEGYLLVNFFGDLEQFAEVEPGVYTNRLTEGTRLLRALVFETDEAGRIMLYPDGPMTYMKAPWYSTGSFNILLLGLALLVLFGSTTGWVVAGLRRYRGRGHETQNPGPNPGAARASRWAAILFTLLALVFLVGAGSVLGQFDPAYGVPRIFFEDPPGYAALMTLPLLMAIAGAAVVFFAVLAWWKGYWQRCARLHYTLFAAATLAFLWFMYFWNLL